MKAILRSGLLLALGWAAGPSSAQEIAFRSAGSAPPAAVTTPGIMRTVNISRPEPIGAVSPALARAQAPEDKPLPLGPAPGTPPRPMAPGATSAPPVTPPGEFTAPHPRLVTPGPQGVITDPNRIWGTHSVPGADDCGPCVDGAVVCGPICCGDCTTPSCFGAWGDCSDRCTGLFWVNGEYLLWFIRSQDTPALVTVSPAGTPLAQSGVLGLPTTGVLYDHINNNPHSGGRFQVGYWFRRFENWGIDASYFFLGRENNTEIFSANTDPQLSRPVIDAVTGRSIAQLVSFPGLVAGTVMVNDFSELWGWDVNLRRRFCCDCNYWFDGFVGYRHLDLTEGIAISEDLNVFNPDGTSAGNIAIIDGFRTRNRFDGVQVGVATQWNFTPRLFVGGSFKLALGNVYQSVDIGGTTTFGGFTAPGAINGRRNGGVLALPTNIGQHTTNNFAVLPELGVKVGLDLTQHLRVYMGYDFLYLSSVVRPSDQIDTVINRTQLPNVTLPGTPSVVGPRRPMLLPNNTTDFWAQGLSWGLQYHW